MSDLAQDFVWTDDAIEMLLRFRESGYSFSEIGAALGVSKNAVIGKWNRLHFAPCRKGSRRSDRTKATVPEKPAKPARSVAPVLAVAPPPPVKAAPPLVQARLVARRPKLVRLSRPADPAEVAAILKMFTPVEGAVGAGGAIVALTPYRCGWPVGDPCAEDFRFCLAAKGPRATYCDNHASVAFDSTPRRLRRRAPLSLKHSHLTRISA